MSKKPIPDIIDLSSTFEPSKTTVATVITSVKPDFKKLVGEAPSLPPLPADAINYVEFVFRPKYEKWLAELKKAAT